MITIPFDLELAKKINNGERNGMIVTDGDNYRVEFVYHREESFPILGVIHTDHGIISDWFSNNGFGGKNYRLKLKVPEYTTFKDGDVLSNEQGDYLFILNTNGEYLTSFHASWKKGRGVVIPRKAHADCNNIEKYRLATEDERQKFIDALKTSKGPKAKMCLKQFFNCFNIDASQCLNGEVEVDETYIGGLNKNRHSSKKVRNARGRSCKDKVPVFGMLQREGFVIAKVVNDTKAGTLIPIINDVVCPGSTIFSFTRVIL